jgi:hypothetical protein
VLLLALKLIARKTIWILLLYCFRREKQEEKLIKFILSDKPKHFEMYHDSKLQIQMISRFSCAAARPTMNIL